MQAVRAIVKPHVISSATGEVLALEDAVAGWLERDARGLILISGKPGSGRTTAMQHLAAVLPREPYLILVDHGDILPEAVDADSIGELLCVVAVDDSGKRRRRGRHLLAEYRLAGWSRDDRIEYLLFHWPSQCSGIISRLNEADRQVPGTCDSLEGIPGVWRVVLDRMAQDDQLGSPVEAVLHEIYKLLRTPEQLAGLQDLCLKMVARRPWPSGTPELGNAKDHILRLTAPRGVMLRLAADRIVDSLKGAEEPHWLFPTLPAVIIREVATLADSEAMKKLRLMIADSKASRLHASAAGILVSANPDWRPEEIADLDLSDATLDGARWSEMDLRNARLASASLANAMLFESDFSMVSLSYADLQSSDLRSSCLAGVDAVMAKFSNADLSCVDAVGAGFTFAKFEEARLDSAKLDYSRLTGCDLTGASLKGASLKFVEMSQAIVDGADFSQADFGNADLDGVRFCESNVRGVRFREASLMGANLEFIDVGSNADFTKAILFSALLTGAQLPGACLVEADLRMAGLADVNLEGADLKGADLSDATFHMGSSRSGLVDSPIACEGSRTGYYTDEYDEKHFRNPDEVRKANLCGANLIGANIASTDFYLVDLRSAVFDEKQRWHFERCGAILE